jgi:hypothetical protein
MTSNGHLCSIGILPQSKPLSSTMLLNCQPPASTYAWCLSVMAIQAPGSTYANIFLCNILCILIEGSLPLPKCTRCGLQMLVEDISRGHHCTGLCQRGWERKCQHEAAVHSKRALEHTFSANREELERVEVFKYLGRLISHDDADNQAMQSNLRKACGCWSQVSCVLWAENATPKTWGMFYKATVQAVLMYGSETWSLSPSSMKRLEGFYICAVWHLSGKRPVRKEDGSWTYPRSEDVL